MQGELASVTKWGWNLVVYTEIKRQVEISQQLKWSQEY